MQKILIYLTLMSFLLISCVEKQELIKKNQISITRNASVLNRELQNYLNIISEVSSFTTAIDNNHELIDDNNDYYYVSKDHDLTDKNFYYLANEDFNPSRNPVFINEPYLNSSLDDYVVSVIAPVYYYDEFQGVVGIDITVHSLFEKLILNPDDNSHTFIISNSGLWVTGEDFLLNLFSITEELDKSSQDLNNHNNSDINNIITKLLEGNRNFIANISNRMYYVISVELQLADWLLVYIVPSWI